MNPTTIREQILYHGRRLYPLDDFNLDDPLRMQMYRNYYLYLKTDPAKPWKQDLSNPDISPWNPRKGICFIGPYGVGKSALFRVYQQIFHNFRIAETKQIELYLKEYGEIETLKEYGYNYPNELQLDDVGREAAEVHVYKNRVTIIGTILNERNRLLLDRGIKTHMTSNLQGNELKKFYDDQIYDRILQSYTLIPWPGVSLRRKHL